MLFVFVAPVIMKDYVAKSDIFGRDPELDCKLQRFQTRPFVSMEDYPSVAFFLIAKSERQEDQMECSGIIIGQKFVLTSAQCFRFQNKIVHPDNVTLFVRQTSFQANSSSSFTIKVGVEQIYVQKSFGPLNHGSRANFPANHTIALVRTSTLVTQIVSVCLPYRKRFYYGDLEADLISWGKQCQQKNTLKYIVEKETISLVKYALIDPCFEKFVEKSYFFCIANHDIYGKYMPVCLADIGAPVIVSKSDKFFIVVGIVSKFKNHGGCGHPFSVVQLNKVSDNTEWIFETTNHDMKLCFSEL